MSPYGAIAASALFAWGQLTPTQRAVRRLVPNAPLEVADAIDRGVRRHGPLFENDPKLLKTTALWVAVAFRESTFDVYARGDHDRSLGLFQELDAPREILGDADAQFDRADKWMRWSVGYCPAFPVAGYARGPRACTNERAQAISDDRMKLAKRILKEWE